MNQLLSDIKAFMVYSKVSMQKLADLVHKDVTTVAKQLDAEKGNPTLANIDVIVRALGARIVLETPESIKAMESADISAYRERISELGAEVARLKDLNAEKDARIERVDRMIAEHKETIRKKDAIIEQKEQAIIRKDELLNAVFKKEILKG